MKDAKAAGNGESMNNQSPRCLYDSSFTGFLNESENSVLGVLCDHYHGDVLTTARET